MQVTVNPAQEHFIHERLDTGLYDSADALFEEALSLLEEREQWFNLDIECLRPAIAQGVAKLRLAWASMGRSFLRNCCTTPQTPHYQIFQPEKGCSAHER